MGLSSNKFLHGSLWLQATALVVLTSLLADSSAWIGAILTAFGLCFVCVGIGAVHMKSLEYLYSYAILVGVWNLLAVAHTLIVCGLLTLPDETIDPVLLVGQKIVDGESDTLKVATPVLYGIQACLWCLSLLCLVCLRVVPSDDLAHGFEIQDSKRTSTTHSLEGAEYTREGQRKNKRSSRSFMGFRQSVVAPLDTHSNRAGVGTSEQQKQEYTHMNQQAEQSYSAHEMQEPERVWMSGERRSSQDSNIIVFPKDKKILQEVLTFRDDITKESDGGLPILTKPVSAGTNEGVLEARTVFITNHYGLGDMLFDKPGESLSDMIFKAAQPLSLDLTSKEVFKTRHTKEFARRGSHDSEQTDSDTRAESPTFSPKSPTLSATTTLDGFGVLEQQEGGKESAGANLSLTLAGDIGELVDDPYSQPSQIAYEDWISRHQGPICAAVPLKHPSQFPTVPERRSSFNHTTQRTHYSPSSGDEGDLDQYEYHTHFVSTAMQPNSPDAHPYSGDYFSSSNTHSPSDHVQSTTQPTPSSRPKPNLASLPLQYWRNRNNGNSNHVEDASSSSPSNTSSVPFSLVNSFSKKKRQPPTLPTAELVPQLPQPPPPPPLPTLMIPTIVLHPDEEDGEPVRVLSEMDIEYLSTMPPAPLRPLIPSWEEGEEDEYYDQDINEGYDYDYYHQGYEQEYEEGEEGEGDEIMAEEDIGYMDAGMDVDEEDGVQAANGGGGVVRIVGRLEQPGINSEVEYDPYALDVPIHLEIDLQGLEQGDITGFGYM